VQRRSVCAEVYGPRNKKEAFQPRIVPKTEEQRERIAEKLKSCFIFNALDKKDLEIVIDAIEEKKVSKDETVIAQGDTGNELYIVDSGTLSCSKKSVKPKYNTLGVRTRV
jgi:cAMP-dependent protein kinase regulator